MAGKPLKRALITELERLTREWDEEGTATPLDFAIDWIESGNTLSQLARQMNKTLGLKPPREISRSMLGRYLETIAPDAEEQMRAARRRGAHGLIDQSIDIADDANDKDSAAAARVQVGVRQWTAERWNKDELGGQQKGMQVQVNIGALHHAALVAREKAGEESAALPDVAARASHQSDAKSLAPGTAIDTAIAQDAEVVSIEPATS